MEPEFCIPKAAIFRSGFVSFLPPIPHTFAWTVFAPAGGLQGNACVCTGPRHFQALKLSGTIYGAWLNTHNSLLRFRLIEPKVFDVGQVSGYFDVFGKWLGQALVMSDRDEVGSRFRSGLNIEHASVTLHWADFWTCKSACASIDRSEADH